MTRDEIIEASPLLTNEEAVRYLRLDTDHQDMGTAVRALHRLVREKRLRPVECGKQYKYALAELNRFIVAETENAGQEISTTETDAETAPIQLAATG
jgi:hypothetical protein